MSAAAQAERTPMTQDDLLQFWGESRWRAAKAFEAHQKQWRWTYDGMLASEVGSLGAALATLAPATPGVLAAGLKAAGEAVSPEQVAQIWAAMVAAAVGDTDADKPSHHPAKEDVS